MRFWKVMNIAVSCVLGILVFRNVLHQAKESGFFEKKETGE